MKKMLLCVVVITLFLLSDVDQLYNAQNINYNYIGSYQNEEYFTVLDFYKDENFYTVKKANDSEFVDVLSLDNLQFQEMYHNYILYSEDTYRNFSPTFTLYDLETNQSMEFELYVQNAITEIVSITDDYILISNSGYNSDYLFLHTYDINNETLLNTVIIEASYYSNIIGFVEDNTLLLNLYFHDEDGNYFYKYDLITGGQTQTPYEKNQYMINDTYTEYYYLFQSGHNNLTVYHPDSKWDQTENLQFLNYGHVLFVDNQIVEEAKNINIINIMNLDLDVIQSIEVPSFCDEFKVLDGNTYVCIEERFRGSFIQTVDYKIHVFDLETNTLKYHSEWIDAGNEFNSWDNNN